MKNILTTVAMVVLTATLTKAQNTQYNYTKTTVPLQPVNSTQAANALADDDKRTAITYYDGLSRPVQQIQYRQSPVQRDIVQFSEYDLLGRESKQYLPYVDVQADMDFKGDALSIQAQFYQSTARVARTSFPFAETVYDNSPLNRVLEKSAPGHDWQLGEGHTSQMGYGTNALNEVRLWQELAGQITSVSFYEESTLYKTTSTDPEGQVMMEFKDQQGLLVLSQKQLNPGTLASTYYVYNTLDQLIAVIPPQAYADMVNYNATNEVPDRIYRYVYDKRGRVVEKKVPHRGWEYTVYDQKDRVVCTQTANQRANNQWSFVKYDELNRPVLSGLLTDFSNRTTMQSAVDAASFTGELRTASNFSTQFGYTNRAFPVSTNLDIHAVNYYDDYDFNLNDLPDVTFSSPPTGFSTPDVSARTYSLPTANKTKVLDGSNTYLTTANWYDERGRLIQTQSDNYLGGKDIVYNDYNFIGENTRTALVHTDGSNNTTTLTQRFSYDHGGRLKQIFHQINEQEEILYCENVYNQLGQLVDKKLHANDLVNPQFLQSIDYAYNIRGWLTHINNADLKDDKYVLDPTSSATIVGVSITNISFSISEVDNETDGHYLTLSLSDESSLEVEGDINEELYNNDEASILVLMPYPGEGEDLATYQALLSAAGEPFDMDYAPALELERETDILALKSGIESDVSDVLEGTITNGNAISRLQNGVFNYVNGKGAFLLEAPASFSSQYLQFYFEVRNGTQLYLVVESSNANQVFEALVMNQNASNQTEFNDLLALTTDITSDPAKITPIIIDFDYANLYEGMGTMSAVEECLRYLSSIVEVGYGITHAYTLEKLEGFAITYAYSTFGQVYFNNDENDLWGMEIKYNSRTNQAVLFPLNNSPLYNGNISETTWQSKGDEVKRGYGYQYDGFSRIMQATYKAKESSTGNWSLENNRYNLSGISYDLNGNIQTLSRKGFTSGVLNQNATFGTMDNLSYSYTGDQLLGVTDQSQVHHINDFNDGNTSGNDYTYDVDGNLTADLNKGVSITYNHMNLPITVDNGSGEVITYIYDASGVKLEKAFNNYGAISKTIYSAIGSYTATGSATPTIDFIFTDEGRLVWDNGEYRYEYFYKDHLGNTRLGFSDYDGDGQVDATEITQQENYYPFGLNHEGTYYGTATLTDHQYLFNGKELQTELDLQWTAMDWRGLDHQIGRFFGVDPLAEDAYGWTPYRFGFNNPVSFSDPSGLFEGWVEGPEGEVAWDPNTNSQEEFDQNYDGQEGYTYVSDADDPNSYTLPSGAGRITLNNWESGGEDGVGRAEINIVFSPTNPDSEPGWVQTFASNQPDVHSGTVWTTPPGENIEERLDGYGVQQSTDLNKARFFSGEEGFGTASPVLDDFAKRYQMDNTDKAVVFRAQSTVILDKKPVISIGWGFSINSHTSHTSEHPKILKSTSQFHQGAVQSVINKTK